MKKVLILWMLLLYSLCSSGQHVVIANNELNVAYVGIPNPITVVVEGYKLSRIMLSTDGGILVNKGDGKYDFTPLKEGRELIKVEVKNINGHKVIGYTSYTIKPIPMPVAAINEKPKGGTICVQSGLIAKSTTIDCDFKFLILSYEVHCFKNNALLFICINDGAPFNMQIKNELPQLKRGDQLIFSNIKCRFPNGKTVKLEDLIIDITK